MIVVIRQAENSLWRTKRDDIVARTGADVVIAEEPDDEVCRRAELLVTYDETPESLAGFPRLLGIAVPIAGVDHLPLETIAARGIAVANAHGNGKYVAERALTLALAVFGKIVPFHLDLSAGEWHGFAAGESVTRSWDSIFGARVAVLGTGSIGSWCARLFASFGTKIVGLRRGTPDRTSDGTPFDTTTARLDEALSGADVVIVTLPLTTATRGMIGPDELEMMRGAVVVNVGRAHVVDERALYEALRAGTLRGAGLDTWYNYPDAGQTQAQPSDYPFHELSNVVLSPHLGGYTRQATRASIDDTVENVIAYLSTGSFGNPVDLSTGY